ncbi:helix-turn-helix transcriptional regulator [Microbacterium atlanticum]|uniref:helix-turn-helix transcriptional regulator n=1 Tax=Microbacterium atlanticum TaxID=2782168 RepID=UPI001E61A784|nr:helix-turn-helix domain-containing protein [Microbacterium atlanticum]
MGEVLTLSSRDIGVVEDTWRQFVPSAALQRVDPRTFAFSWSSAALPHFSTVRYELSASVQSAIDPEGQLMACRVASRGSWVGTPRGELNAGLPWVALDGPTSARWRDRAEVRAFVFDREWAETEVRRLTGEDRFSLRHPGVGSSPVNRDFAAHWERVFLHIAGSLFAPGPRSHLIEAELRRHALHATLAAFSPEFGLALQRSVQRRAAPRSVQRAIAYLEEHAHEAITIDDVAEAAGISTRGLQYAFRRALDMTPTDYLRRRRLEGAHAEMQAGTASSVGEIALRWGFASASRFAKHYRDAYGRTPRQTLRGG